MKKRRAYIQTQLFFFVLIYPSLLWGILGLLGLNSRLQFDTGENRNMHTLPSDTRISNLTSELEQAYDDHVPFRSILLQLNRDLEGAVEKPYSGGIEPFLLNQVNRRHNREVTENTEIISDDSVSDNSHPASNIEETQEREKSVSENSADGIGTDSTAHVHNFQVIERHEADFENYGYVHYRCACGEEKTEYIEKLIDSSFFPYKEIGSGVIQGRFEWLFYKETLEDYQCLTMYDAEELAEIANRFLTLRNLCSERNVDVKYLIFPNKNTVYPEYMPTLERGENSSAQQLEDYLKANTDLDMEYTYAEIVAEKPYHQLYYKQDTHWNAWGALTAVNVLHRMLGMPEITQEQLNPESSLRPRSDLLMMAGMNESDAAYDLDWWLHYRPETKVTISLKDQLYTEAVSDAADTRKVVLVGDSYNEMLVKILACDFSNVIYINWKVLDEVDPELITGANILVMDAVERSVPKMVGETAEKVIAMFS